MRGLPLFSFSLILAIIVPYPTNAYTAPDLYLSQVAGGSEGFKDGVFNDSRFSKPSGMVFDADGKTLYVADMGNNRIRMIHTDRNNAVETLAGTGAVGSVDGSFLTTTFNGPCNLTLAGDILLVYDCGDHMLRFLDLKAKTVSSLSLAQFDLTQAAYCPLDGNYYFTDMTAQVLMQVDLKTKVMTTLLSKDPRIPHPRAICYMNGDLFVTDNSLPQLFRFPIDPKTPVTGQNLQWNSSTKVTDAVCLLPEDGTVYALQKGAMPLAQVYPTPRFIDIPSIWGFFLPHSNEQAEALVNFDQSPFCAGAISPRDPRKIYLCGMTGQSSHVILSYRDYDYSNHWIGADPHDYDYPSEKPPKTFRILVAGDSRVVTSPRIDFNDNTKGGGSLLMDTYAKQLEIMLNTEAALQGVDTRFEVLIEAHLDESWMDYGNYDMDEWVKKYDIDLILPIPTWNYKDFYRKTIGPDGLPPKDRDMEYLVKPLAQRVPPGPAGELYRYWDKKRFCDESCFLSHEFTYYMTDPVVRDCIIRMLEVPLSALGQKISKLRLKDGSTPRLIATYFPWDAEEGDSATLEAAYTELCEKAHVPLLDISKEFNLLRTTYAPTQQACCDHHYTLYGNRLIAMLLCRHLIADKLLPFEPSHSSK